MNWETIKKSADASILDGITVEIDKTDISTNAVTLTDGKGNKIRVRLSSYDLHVEVPAKVKVEKKFKVEGEIKGVKVDEIFDHKYEADARVSDLGYDAVVAVSEVDSEIQF